MTTTINQWKGRIYSFQFTDPSKPVRTFRSRRPCHFVFEIQNYLELKQAVNSANMEYFETPEFAVGNEKWTMCIYPAGKGVQGAGCVSLYLRRQKSGGRGRESSVSMKFFILEQNADEYLVIEDMGEKNFDVRGKEWGIAQAIDIVHFEDENNGFLTNKENNCTFGAELFGTSSEPSYSQLALVKANSRTVFEIGIRFNAQQDYTESATFATTLDGDTYTWKLRLYINGHGAGATSYVSLYLILVDTNKLSNGRRMLVNFNLSLKSKSDGIYSHTMPAAALEWYQSTKDSGGYPKFIGRAAFFDSKTQYDYNQTADVKVEFNNIFLLNDADG